MILGLYLVELKVTHWAASVSWYRDRLGLEVLFAAEADRFALLRAGGSRLAIKAGRPEPGSVLLTFEVEDLTAELKRLAALGVIAEDPIKVSPEGYRRVHLLDPDGYRLCLFDWGARPDPGE